MTARTWAECDRVAIRDLVTQPYRLGTITGITGTGHLLIRLDKPVANGADVAIRHPDDVRVIPVDDVPVDQRWWVPERTRDQLAAVWPHDGSAR